MIDIKYKNIYDKFIEHYKNVHVNPWHEINETKLQQLYDNLINSMDINDEPTFKYFMDYILKRLSGSEDAHTTYESISLIPMNFRIFNDEVLVNYPEDLKFGKVLSINDIDIKKIIDEIEEIITYGTNGKRIYELEKSLLNKRMLLGIPSLRSSTELVFEIEMQNGNKVSKSIDIHKVYTQDELSNYNEYIYGRPGDYYIIDNCLVFKHSSIQQRYKDQIENSINNLRKEDLTNIDTIIIDIRGNSGGNAALNKILMDFIIDNKDKNLICLTDYRVFSGGRYALLDLINLGATTIGEEISTPMNCYGNSNLIKVDNHWFYASECYHLPFFSIDLNSKEEFKQKATDELLKPYIFHPDILVEENKEDYINKFDIILDYALKYVNNQKRHL